MDMPKSITESPSVEKEKNLPTFEHDCDECEFLGTFNDEDLYIHIYKDDDIYDDGDFALTSRFGEDGDYEAVTFELKENREPRSPQLKEALRRAKEKGLL